MQKQITVLTNLLKSQMSQSVNVQTTSKTNEQVTKTMANKKRTHSEGSASSSEAVPAKMTPSSRQEDKSSATSEEMEAPQPSGNTTSEGTVAGRERVRRSHTSARVSSVPPAPQGGKEGVVTGSSVSKGNKGGEVSKPKKDKYGHIKSRILAPTS